MADISALARQFMLKSFIISASAKDKAKAKHKLQFEVMAFFGNKFRRISAFALGFSNGGIDVIFPQR